MQNSVQPPQPGVFVSGSRGREAAGRVGGPTFRLCFHGFGLGSRVVGSGLDLGFGLLGLPLRRRVQGWVSGSFDLLGVLHFGGDSSSVQDQLVLSSAAIACVVDRAGGKLVDCDYHIESQL